MKVIQENTIMRVVQEETEQVVKVVVEEQVVKATRSDEVTLLSIDGNSVNDKNYVHEQQVASTHWVVSHGLGKYPNVTILDDQMRVIEADVIFTNANQIDIYFSANISGQVVLN